MPAKETRNKACEPIGCKEAVHELIAPAQRKASSEEEYRENDAEALPQAREARPPPFASLHAMRAPRAALLYRYAECERMFSKIRE